MYEMIVRKQTLGTGYQGFINIYFKAAVKEHEETYT